ncbi:hypothetical protein L1887_53946 [Cichorium endivia]|nr:hypothetical protein L1887_53946 [Cichorium endivia]
MMRGSTPCSTSDDGTSGILSTSTTPSAAASASSSAATVAGLTASSSSSPWVGRTLDRGKVNVELLDDGRIQRVEVHDEDVLVPQPTLGLEHQTALELVLLAAGRRSCARARGAILGLGLGLELSHLLDLLLLPRRDLVRADVLLPVEVVQQNVLVALGTAAVERLVPAVARQVGELLGERQDLHLGRNRHLEERVHLAVAHVRQQPLGRRRERVEERRGLFGVDVLALDLEMRGTHLGQRPGGRGDHRLAVVRGQITHESAGKNLEVHALLELGPLGTAEAADARPVVRTQILHAVQQHVERHTVELVADDDVGVGIVDLRQQRVEQHALVLERVHLDLALARLGLEAGREHAAERPHRGEDGAGQLLGRRGVFDLVVGPRACADSHKLLLVLLVVDHGANRERHDGKRRRLAWRRGVRVRDRRNVLGILDGDLHLAPRDGRRAFGDAGVRNLEPARAKDACGSSKP